MAGTTIDTPSAASQQALSGPKASALQQSEAAGELWGHFLIPAWSESPLGRDKLLKLP
jgi:hypothetical protein